MKIKINPTLCLILLILFFCPNCSDNTKINSVPKNSPPAEFSLSSPDNRELGVKLNSKLAWQASSDADRDNLTYTVYLGTANPPTTQVSTDQNSTAYTPTGQTGNTKYYWKVVVKDGKGGQVSSAVWSYTTLNRLPNPPLLTSPNNAITNVELNRKLVWQASSDADRDNLTYTVYLGTANPPTTRVSTDQNSTAYTPTGQTGNTKYYWKVVVKDGKGGQVSSAVWNYTTLNRLPNRPVLTSPNNAITNVKPNRALVWQASSDADRDNLTYTVYLGTANPPTTQVSTDQNGTSYTPVGQLKSTKYYWKIVVKDGKGGQVSSAVWNYTTIHCTLPRNEPAYNLGTIFLDSNIINIRDPSSFKSVSYVGRGERSMFDRRGNGEVRLNAYLFEVKFDDGLQAEAQVNPEFKSQSEAMKQVRRYAFAIGKLPTALRKDVKIIVIHKGNELFGGGNNELLIHTDQGESYIKRGILEETFIHEAAHTSLDQYHYNNRWRRIQCDDGIFISQYAKDYPNREDIAESVLLYIAVKYKSDRISEANKSIITKSIPNRIRYFESLSLNMYPIK